MRKALVLIWLLLALCLPCSGFSSDENALQALVDNALAGSTVLIPQGVYRGGLVINKALTLTGLSTEATIIEATSDTDVIHVNASNVCVSHVTLRNFWPGIQIYNPNEEIRDVLIENNRFIACFYAVTLANCRNVVLRNNEVQKLNQSHTRISIQSSEHVTVMNNNLTGADLYLNQFNHDCLIHANTISYSHWGLILQDSWNNTITRNTFHDNYYALECSYKLDANPWMPNLSKNLIYCNNFIDNWVQARISFDAVDSWNNRSHGNYWSDYTGEDSDLDGIGDTAYYINHCNQDNHPLMTDPPPQPPIEEETECLQFHYGLLTTVVSIKLAYPNGYVATRSVKTIVS